MGGKPKSPKYYAKYRAEHREELRVANAKYYAEHREERLAYTTTYYAEHPEKRRADSLKSRYGLTLEEYDALFAKQGGVCAICGHPPKTRRLDVDHNHKTGAVRGLLCHLCNRALGLLRVDSNPERCKAAAAYLEKV